MEPLLSCLTAFFVTFLSIVVLTPFAKKIGLVDKPGGRKKHKSVTPLTGGIAIYMGLVSGSLFLAPVSAWVSALMVGAGILLLVGALDDRNDLPVKLRLGIHFFVAMIMILQGENLISDFGLIFADTIIPLGWLSVPITIIAVIGAINSVNMSDGADGLSSGLILNTLMSLLIVTLLAPAGHFVETEVACVLIASVLAFWLFNFRFPSRSGAIVFMGDAGTNFLGYALVWMLISLSSGDQRAMPPVLALWIFAIPLMDTISVMVRRILKGKSAFAADRTHLHHLFIDRGFSVTKTVLMIYVLSAVFSLFGIIAVYAIDISQTLLFVMFVLCFTSYFYITKRCCTSHISEKLAVNNSAM